MATSVMPIACNKEGSKFIAVVYQWRQESDLQWVYCDSMEEAEKQFEEKSKGYLFCDYTAIEVTEYFADASYKSEIVKWEGVSYA